MAPFTRLVLRAVHGDNELDWLSIARVQRALAEAGIDMADLAEPDTAPTGAVDSPKQVVIAGHAFLQNLRRGHYDLGVDAHPALRVVVAFTEVAQAI